MRCDRVDFPAGGEALTHVHQGPGIRCRLSGTIRIDAEGQSHSYGPGGAWFAAVPERCMRQRRVRRPPGLRA